jgi:hypothetical protein
MIEPNYVDMVKVRDEEIRGKSMEQIARCGMFVHSANPAVGHKPDRWSRFIWDEIVRGQMIVAINNRLQAKEGVKPVQWLIGGIRADVIVHYPYMGDLIGFDPSWGLGMSEKAWDRTRRNWENNGWKWGYDSGIASLQGQLETALAKRGQVPVPYVQVNATNKTLNIYCYAMDVRQDRWFDWLIEKSLEMAKATGCWTFWHGFKSGLNENTPSQIVLPDSVHQLEYQNGESTWQSRPHNPGGTMLTYAHYKPGEFLDRFMVLTKRMRMAGIEILLNEAYANQGRRWLWTEKYPEVAGLLIGEMQVRTMT